ncbi:MAG: cytochrome C [Bryobacteraceae bacterium]|jgi:cytochrome c553
MLKSVAFVALAATFVLLAQTPPADPGRPSWAFLTPDKQQPPATEESGPIKVPGSGKEYTAAQIDDLSNPPVWFPDEHGAAPSIVQHGKGAVLACGSCHLMSGHGHQESADLAGLSADYIVRTMADFKSGTRIDPARMNAIAKGMSDEDIRQAAEYFAALKPGGWIKVVESETAPKSYVSVKGRQRLPLPGGGMELLGNRIIELPDDVARATSRDPHSGFVAYVPKGSVGKGAALVKTGANKTIACAICHGDSLEGLGDVPRIAGLHPAYVARQLYAFQTGTNHSVSSALMKKVVANLTADDILAIAAYTAAQ